MNRAAAISLVGLLLAAGGWLFWQCDVNQNVNFLPPGPGQWIVYPTPPQAFPISGMTMTAVFRHSFVQPPGPAVGVMTWRCFKAGRVILNGTNIATNWPAYWKKTERIDVAGSLHPGTNEIEVQVDCSNGLPAVSLGLQTKGLDLQSDKSWDCSLADAVWQPAHLASQPVAPAPGHVFYKAEDLGGAIQETWPLGLAFAVIAMVAVVTRSCSEKWLTGRTKAASFILLAGLWALLFVHNLPLLPAMSGFDAGTHLAYIDYIRTHRALPAANQGWEFFQAPLYYLMGALWLGAFHLRALQPEAAQILGLMNLLLGLAELAIILASMRLLFPGQRRPQMTGLLFAAFLPAQVYALHYPTNEMLGAVTSTGAFWLCLKILREPHPPLRWHAGLGLVLGAALLSKASCVLTVVAIVLALGVKAFWERASWAMFLRQTGVCLLLCLGVGGWHYARLWQQFGNPFAGNWDPAVGGVWWQQPSYHTASYFLSFGRSLSHPLFSGFYSFWDGLYSTCWGDGLLGGATILYGRPPWNYNLMAIGFVLALVPSALILIGLWKALREGICRRRMAWLVVGAVPLLFGFAILSMSLKLPFYAQSRALYGLPAIMPLAALGALGLEICLTRLARGRVFLLAWMIVWMLTVYASFWIRPDAVQTRLAMAMGIYGVSHEDPGPSFEKVLALDPRNAIAIVNLADLEKSAGHLDRAIARLQTAATVMTNEMIDTALAQDLGEQGRVQEALAWAGRACALTVDYPPAPALLCSLSLQAGLNEQAATAGRAALRLEPWNDDFHFNTGLAWARMQRYKEAAAQFSDATRCLPSRADAHYFLGVALWNLPGRADEARKEVATAVQLAPQNADWKSMLARMQKRPNQP